MPRTEETYPVSCARGASARQDPQAKRGCARCATLRVSRGWSLRATSPSSEPENNSVVTPLNMRDLITQRNVDRITGDL